MALKGKVEAATSSRRISGGGEAQRQWMGGPVLALGFWRPFGELVAMVLLKSKPYIKSYDHEADRERQVLHETVTSRRCDRDTDANHEW